MEIQNVTGTFAVNEYEKAKEAEVLMKKAKRFTAWEMPRPKLFVGETVEIVNKEKILKTAEKAIETLTELKELLKEKTPADEQPGSDS